jgi:hypothetical protein
MKLVIVLLFVGVISTPTFSWVYPEHRDIAILAVQKLSPEYRSILDKLWSEARKGFEYRLTEAVIDATQSTKPSQLDFASWPAIAGDHSCSPENMMFNVLQTDWILKVADIAAQLKIDLANSKNHSQRVNALRDSDIKFQRSDPEYATRAGSNNVHFLLSRLNYDITAVDYLTSCVKEGTELNAIGAYVYFHTSALYKAARYFNEQLTHEEKSALILAALAEETFALHFLEDVFASGHVAGTRGDASQRKGTHDYYNEKGLEVVTWDGERMVITGDAYMRDIDVEKAALIIKISLEQLIDAASGKLDLNFSNDPLSLSNTPEDFSVCSNNFMPDRYYDPKLSDLYAEILLKTPVPGLADGLGEYPRFRAELGMFIGTSPSLRGLTYSSGFDQSQTKPGALVGLDVSLRVGLGIDGIINESGDGLVFFDIGWRQDGPATMKYGQFPNNIEGGQITSAIPGRDALNMRLRMPFYLVPFDLLIAAPILGLTDPETFTTMAVIAGNGGLIPWQTGIATPIGKFQFVLGREVGIAIYGNGNDKDALLINNNGITQLVNYKSVQISLPILEYKPLRTFSIDQSSSLLFQLEFGIDIPYGESVASPIGTEIPELRTIYFLGLRTTLDWRYYL